MDGPLSLDLPLRASNDGGVAVPPELLAQAGWTEGMDIHIAVSPGSIALRSLSAKRGRLSVEEASARIRAILPYDGPRVTEDDVEEAITDHLRDKFGP